MSTTRALPPAVATAAAKGNPLAKLAQVGVATMLAGTSRPRVSVKLPSRLSSSSSSPLRMGSSTPMQLGTSLTPLNLAGVQSASQQACKCPEPKKKEKKEKRDRCVNPVISRTVKDGIRTTKVELKCQPSKPKFP